MLSLLTYTSSKIFCPTFAEKQKEIEETGHAASHFLKGTPTYQCNNGCTTELYI
jgi:hypothetical protein